jgi:hypothetical protein
VRDFDSISSLGNYLTDISSDAIKYASHLEWKKRKNYPINFLNQFRDSLKNLYCRICDRVSLQVEFSNALEKYVHDLPEPKNLTSSYGYTTFDTEYDTKKMGRMQNAKDLKRMLNELKISFSEIKVHAMLLKILFKIVRHNIEGALLVNRSYITSQFSLCEKHKDLMRHSNFDLISLDVKTDCGKHSSDTSFNINSFFVTRSGALKILKSLPFKVSFTDHLSSLGNQFNIDYLCITI